MKKTLVKILNCLCSIFPLRKTIVFESNPDMSCNSYEVFKKIYEREYFSDYRFIWTVNSPKKYIEKNKYKRTKYINKNPKFLFKKIINYFIINRSMIAISSCVPFNKKFCSKYQLNIYLDHGSQLKKMKDGDIKVVINCDYTISQGVFFNKYITDQYTIFEKQILNFGIPRNDQFYQETLPIKRLFKDADNYNKIIAWVPTFRKALNNRIDCNFDMPLGIPILYSEESVEKINSILKSKSILLVIKPHPALDLKTLKNLSFSNIQFLYNDQMLDNGFHTNNFLKCCDAIITDYSGIYYDFLCLNKPIGITLDDFDDYSKQHGFVFENPLDILKGFYIKNIDDMVKFVLEVSNNIDSCFVERNIINEKINDFFDGKSTDRLCDFIENEMRKKLCRK